MAHEISIANGKAEAMYTKVPAWHGLGTVVENAPTAAECIKLAHLDWQVTGEPMYLADGTLVPNFVATVRDQIQDNKKILGVVGDGYRIVQNLEMFKLMDSIVDCGGLRYESAGALRNGKTIWLLARMPESTDIKGDVLDNYILLKSGHDGGTAMEMMLTKTRVVCMNTLRVALSNAVNKIRVKHCMNATDKMVKARETVLGIKKESDQLDQILRDLSIVGIVESELDKFIHEMFPLPTVADKEPSKKTLNIHDKIRENFEFAGELTAATKGTAYGALNAVTRWVDHQRLGDKDMKRWESAMFGSGAELKAKALVTAQKQFLG